MCETIRAEGQRVCSYSLIQCASIVTYSRDVAHVFAHVNEYRLRACACSCAFANQGSKALADASQLIEGKVDPAKRKGIHKE